MPECSNGSKGGLNPGYLDCESGVLSLSHRAPCDMITSQRFQLGTLSQDNDIFTFLRQITPSGRDVL